MAAIPHVQPGDLITAELMNAIIDALTAADLQADDVLDRINRLPVEPSILFIDPPAAISGMVINIHGVGFIPESAGENTVYVGGQPMESFAIVTRTLIQGKVPELKVAPGTTLDVVVKNQNGETHSELVYAPSPLDVPFVPSPPEVVETMMSLAGVSGRDTVYDLGSGDGRIVITAAQLGAKGVGFDLDPERIAEARQRAQNAGVADRARFEQRDIFSLSAGDLSEATVITLHLLPSLNLRLRPVLEALKPSTVIVSHQFDMGDWPPDKQDIVDVGGSTHHVYLWKALGR